MTKKGSVCFPFFLYPYVVFYQPIMKALLKEPSRRKVLFKFRYLNSSPFMVFKNFHGLFYSFQLITAQNLGVCFAI